MRPEPFAHQRETFEASKNHEHYALWWEPGLGKSRTVLDTAAHLFLEKKITGLLIVAPNGVHANWASEVEKHMIATVATEVLVYEAAKAGTQKAKRAMESLLACPTQQDPVLPILAIGYGAVATANCRKVIAAFMKKSECLCVLDEVTRIKTPGAQRTKALMGVSKLAAFRRILTGTPVANSPFDVYAPILWLMGADFLRGHEAYPYTVFKRRFGIWETRQMGARSFPELVSYRNLEALHDMLHEVGDRRTKDEALDLPPKLYSRREFMLTTEQRNAYGDLRRDCQAEVSGGNTVTAMLAITKMIRFAQITSGFVSTDNEDGNSGGAVVDLGAHNPRLDLLSEITSDLPHKAIIWARFTRDIDKICALLGKRCVRYDGSTKPDARLAAIEAFTNGDAQFFVANPAAAGQGLTLHADGKCRTVIYFNNTFSLDERLQSEDRAHRIGQPHPVHYIDIVAGGTIDDHVLRALREKRTVAGVVTGDNLHEWI